VQFGVVGDAIGLDVFGHRFIDIALRKLGITKAGAMADELVRARTANAGENEVPYRMFEDGSMADFEYMAEVRFVAARPRFGERHIADAASDFGEIFTGDVGIAFPGGDLMVGEEAIDLGVVGGLAADKVYRRLAENADVGGHYEMIWAGREIVQRQAVRSEASMLICQYVLIDVESDREQRGCRPL
jgi:hypothetical protein